VKRELLLVGIILVLLTLASCHVIVKAHEHWIGEQARGVLKTDRPPYRHIPRCDAPTWERVTDGCSTH
jgi:hypothetical protein